MAKRMILMLTLAGVLITALGFVKFKQIQTAMAEGAAFQPPPEAVTTIVAKAETWPSTLNAVGTAAAVQGVTVSADLSGTVERITFDSGRAVRAGEVLVELNTRQERSQLAALEAQRDLARLTFDRMQGLLTERVISRAEFDQATTEQKQTEARVGGNPRHHRAQDHPRAVLWHPRHPSGQPRTVPSERVTRSWSCRR